MSDDEQPTLPPTESAEQVYPTPANCDYKKPPVLLTMERKMRFLFELRRTGLFYRAAELVGVTTATVSAARKREPDFDAACQEAKNRYVDEVLVSAAVKRAVEGVTRPIIGGQYRDEIVAHEVVYSDSLLALLLKASRPEFRDSVAADLARLGQAAQGVVVLPSAPQTAEEWEAKCGESANPKE